MNRCNNIDFLTGELFLHLFLISAHAYFEVLHDLVLDSRAFFSRDILAVLVLLNVDETEHSACLRIFTSLLDNLLFSLFELFLFINDLLTSLLSDILQITFHLGSFLICAAELFLFEEFTQVWISTEVDWVSRSTQRFPVYLFDRLQALEVVFKVCWVLPGYNLDAVRLFSVIARTEQEDEAFALQWLQLEVTKVERDLARTVTVINIVWFVSTDITGCVLFQMDVEHTIWSIKPHLMLYFCQGP